MTDRDASKDQKQKLQEERDARLRKALRANLQRRKAQNRARTASDKKDAPEGP